MNNSNEISMKFENKVTGEKKLERYAQQLQQIKNSIQTMPKGVVLGGDLDKKLDKTNKLLVNLNKNMSSFKRSTTSALGNMSKDFTNTANAAKKLVDNTKNLNKNAKDTTDTMKNLGDKLGTAINVGALATYVKSFMQLVQTMSKFTQKSSDYLENLNLMNVAFGNTKEKVKSANNEALKFVNTLSEMYGLDESEVIKAVGTFKNLANAMQLSDDVGTKLSKTLTQLSIDVSSLYNIDFEDAMSKIQSALAGQTKPVRFLGADITQATLQVTLDSYGIDRTIESLSYAEKRLVIVTSLLNQLNASQNDYGKTVENTANQMRVFDQQLQRLSRAIGNVFMPVLAKVLPYMNAVLMVLVEIINYLAMLLGFKVEDFDVFADIETDIDGIGDSLDSAGESAKKLKQGLRGFDKLNVISSPSSSGSGSVGVGGVDVGIMNALNKATEEYNKKLEKIKMKATDIRDNILKWLGFTVETDEETGEVSIKFDHITSGTVLGALAVGGVIFSGINSIYKTLKKIGLLDFSNVTGLSSQVGSKLTPLQWLGIGTLATADVALQLSSTWGQIDKLKTSLDKGDLGSFFKVDSLGDLIEKVTTFTYLVQGGLVPAVAMAVVQFASGKKNIDENTQSLINLAEKSEYVKKKNTEFADNFIMNSARAKMMATNNINELIQASSLYLSTYKKNLDEQNLSDEERTKKVDEATNTILGIYQLKYGQEIPNALTDSLKKQSNVLMGSNESKTLQSDWREVANASKDNYINGLSPLPGDLSNNLTKLDRSVKSSLGIGSTVYNSFGTSANDSKNNYLSNINDFQPKLTSSLSTLNGSVQKTLGKNSATYNTFGQVGKDLGTTLGDNISNNMKVNGNTLNKTWNSATSSLSTKINQIKNDGALAALGVALPAISLRINGYANGGLPNVGQMFIANERGPELVGQIGGQSFVANQNQMMDLLDKKIGSTQSSTPQIFNIYLDESHKIGTYTLNQLQDMAKSNGKPITIGG